MGKFLLKISRPNLCKLIVLTLLNKFDFFLCIEGNTGTGKSTLAIHIARGVKQEFRRLFRLKPETVEYYYKKVIEKQNVSIEEFCQYLLQLKKENAYNYNPYNDLIYDQKNMMRGLSAWRRIIIPDEMINITFNRDFQGDAQKKIIKLLNMYRDHNNFIIASVPQFNTLDVQIKNLTKMRVSIAKRGVGVVQTPNKIMYGKDKWDSANNEKIERQWLIQGGKPRYTKLTTSRGLISFPTLPKSIEAEYQKIKNSKRSNIVEVELGIIREEKKDPFSVIYGLLLDGKVRNVSELTGLAKGMGLDGNAIQGRLHRQLVKECKPTLSEHYWDKKARKNENTSALATLLH
jgi:KaiC/GvpD/RAD55 family RecA-like ATPase